jgi:MoxR-like ATPase
MRGRDHVLPDDVKALAEPVLAHRIIVEPAARMRGVAAPQIISRMLEQIPLPDAGLPP